MLSPRELAVHLESRGLLSPADVVSRGVRIADQSRRNRNFRVRVGRGGYFIKQSRPSDTMLDVEAEIYRCVRGLPLAQLLPLFRDFDRRRRVLVLQLAGGKDLGALLLRRGRMSRSLAANIGHAVATIHESSPAARLPALKPWILSLPCPPAHLMRDISSANVELLRIVQRSKSLSRELTALESSWSDASLIHHDLRFANCLVEKQRIRIVDWELAGWGDPSWDLGCVFAEFLSFWIASMPFVPGLAPSQLARRARVPLQRLRPAIASVWRSYESARSRPGPRGFLTRSVRFAGARLIQTAYEHLERSSDLTPQAVALLQVSANMVTRPADAATTLLGIPVDAHG